MQYKFRPPRTRGCNLHYQTGLAKNPQRDVKLNFISVDFKSTFDTIWIKALWKIMRIICIENKITSIIENVYNKQYNPCL